jgi:tetratricopeptide (TPR) repeat protein
VDDGTNASREQPLAERIASTWNFGDPRASEAQFLALVEQLAQRGDAAGRAQALTQVARARGLDRRIPEGHRTLDALEAELGEQPPVVRVRFLLERGRLFNSAGAPLEARPLFEQAWELGRSAGLDALAVDAAHMVAITHLSEPAQAIAWNDTALELARASRERRARLWLGSLLNNQGWSYFERHEYDRALALFQEAYEFRVQQDTEQPSNGAGRRIAAWCVARALRALGRLDEALARQTQLAEEWEAAGSGDGFVFEELGECHFARGQSELAASYFVRAHALLSKNADFVAEHAARLERIARLGGVAGAER